MLARDLAADQAGKLDQSIVDGWTVLRTSGFECVSVIPFSEDFGGWDMDQPGFFDIDERLARLSGLGDQLEAFSRAVDFELFRPELEKTLSYSDGSKGGRPPFDPVMMFKILVIQTINTLSDERTEYLINDRLSFMRFLGLGLSDRVPDAKTIWLFRERLTKAGAIGPLFERFDAMLRDGGYIPMSGQIVDASLVAAPPRNHFCHKTLEIDV